jgi:hypothetical protein
LEAIHLNKFTFTKIQHIATHCESLLHQPNTKET